MKKSQNILMDKFFGTNMWELTYNLFTNKNVKVNFTYNTYPCLLAASIDNDGGVFVTLKDKTYDETSFHQSLGEPFEDADDLYYPFLGCIKSCMEDFAPNVKLSYIDL